MNYSPRRTAIALDLTRSIDLPEVGELLPDNYLAVRAGEVVRIGGHDVGEDTLEVSLQRLRAYGYDFLEHRYDDATSTWVRV